MTPEHRFIELASDRYVHVALSGDRAGRQVVFLPGNGCSIDDLGPLAPAIAAGRRLIAIDPPGRVPTVWPDEPFHFIHDLLPVMDRVIAAAGVGAHVVIGHSMGAMLALQHARRHRHLVRGLVMMEGFISLEVHARVVSPQGFRAVRMSESLRRDWERRRADNAAWEAAHPRFRDNFWPSQKEHDAGSWVADLGVPIFVIVGDMGQPMPPASDLNAWRAHLGMDHVRDLEVCVVPQAGHWMMLDDPPAVTDPVLRFLARTLGPGRDPLPEPRLAGQL